MSIPPWQQVRQAAAFVASRTRVRPSVGIVLGSGLAGIAGAVADAEVIPYTAIPHWPVPTVVGHPVQLILGTLAGRSVAVMQGRAHLYEGFPVEQLALPIRVLHRMGARLLVVTNAAGGLNSEFRCGDLMLIEDHVGLPSLGGQNPLRGPNEAEVGPRFPDLSRAYDPDLLATAERVATEAGMRLQRGVYAWVAGPSYETPAETRLLRTLGCDAVGMSTVPEVIAARHVGMSVLAVSCITNVLTGPTMELSHEEVVAVAASAADRLAKLIVGVLAQASPAES